MADTEQKLLQKIVSELKAGYAMEAQNKEALEVQLKENGQSLYHAIAHGDVAQQKELMTTRNQLKESIAGAAELSQSAFYSIGEKIQAGHQAMMPVFDKIGEGIQKIKDLNIKQYLRMPTVGDLKQAAKWTRDNAMATLNSIRELPGKIGATLEKIPGVSAIMDGIKTFGNVVKLGLQLAGAAIGLQGFLNGWKKAMDWFGANATFGEKLASGLAGLVGIFTGLSEEEMKKLAQSIAGVIDWFYTEAMDLFQGIFGGLKDAITGLLEGDNAAFMAGLRKAADAIVDFALNLGEKVLSLFVGEDKAGQIINGIRGFITPILDFIQSIGPAVIDALGQTLDNAMQFLGGLWDLVAGAFTGDTSRISEGVSAMWDGVVGQINTLFDLIGDVFDVTGITDAVTGAWDNVIGTITSTFDAMYNSIVDMANGVIRFINDKLDYLPGFDANTIDEIERAQATTTSAAALQAADQEREVLEQQQILADDARRQQSQTNNVAVQQNVNANTNAIAAAPKTKPGASNPYADGGSHWFWGPKAYN